MQCRKIGTGFNDEIGIIHRIAYKFVGLDFAFEGDFNCFVSSNLATANFYIYNIRPPPFVLII
jgi:hypothetical protein